MSNTVNDSAIKKLKLLFTIVDRPKGEFYMDVISQFDVNYQMVVGGMQRTFTRRFWSYDSHTKHIIL